MPKHKPSSSMQRGGPKPKRACIMSTQSDINEESEEGEPFNQSQNTSYVDRIKPIEGDLGIIEKISLQNFRCHERLDCTFGPNMNFVVGCNGSGKSAILMAIIVGLGGRPISFGCSNSLRHLVKVGKDVAEICIKLRNRGHDAYKPDIYGPSITVMTRIHKDGNTTYMIMLADGEFVSRNEKELSNIMNHLNIGVDNPVTFMDEDTCKNFLLKQSAKDKYKFFQKATQLGQVSKDCCEIMLNKETIEDSMIELNAKLPLLEMELRTLTHLQVLIKREEPINLSSVERIAESKEDDVKRTEEKHALIHSQGEALRQRLGDLSPKLDIANNYVQELKTIVESLEREIELVTPLIQGNGSDERNILPRIRDQKENSRDRAQFEVGRLERERQITSLVEEKRDLEAQKQNAMREMEQFANADNSARERIYGLLSKESELTQVISAGDRKLKNLEWSRKNRLKLYGDYMPNLLAEIDRSAARFHQKPLGPVGSFLKLKDARWALGVESCLKRLMYSFCCHDQHDSSILRDIMNRIIPQYTPQPSITTSKFEQNCYDVHHEAEQGRGDFPGFLDIVDVSHPVIFNTLIDQSGVESVLLIERSMDAVHYLRQHPQSCRMASTLAGDQIYPGPPLRFYSSIQRTPGILQESIDSKITETEEDIGRHTRALTEVQKTIQSLRQALSAKEIQKMTALQQRSKLDDKIGKINIEITRLEGRKEEETNVADLEEEVQQMEAKINERKEKLERFSKNFKDGRRQLSEATQQFKVVDDQIQELSYQVDPLKNNIAGSSNEAQPDEQRHKHYEEKKKELMEKLANLQKEADKVQSKMEETISKARQMSRKVDSTELDIGELSMKFGKKGNIQGDLEDATKQCDEPRKKFASIQNQMKGLMKTAEKVNQIIDQHDVAMKDMSQFICQRTKYYFISMMSSRGYLGRLKFDHPKEELIITVELDERERVKDVFIKDIRSLSSGERALSTLCLIIALWESVESPIRAMDGFDMMDVMNRKICIELLLLIAREQSIRQFIIFTSQDIRVPPNEFVRITRLEAPEMNRGYIKEEPMEEQD